MSLQRKSHQLRPACQLRDDLDRVRRHLVDTATHLNEMARRIPPRDELGKLPAIDLRRHGSSTSSILIGLELAMRDVTDRACQLIQSLDELTRHDGRAR